MKTIVSIAVYFAMLFSQLACVPLQRISFHEQDITPPVLLDAKMTDENTIAIAFDESATIIEIAISPDVVIASMIDRQPNIEVQLEESIIAGEYYQMHAVAEDTYGNSIDFLVDLYGVNTNIPDLIINEFTTQGSKTRPDRIELFARLGGNLAGVSLYVGTPETWEARLIMPSISVEAGEYIVAHAKAPEGAKSELDNKNELTIAGAVEETLDLIIPEGKGLSGNNGVIVLTARPEGDWLDAAIYSNRSSESDDRYRGFGNKKMLERAEQAVANSAWKTDASQIAPEDAIPSNWTTSTRSISRSSDSYDSDSREDWHTTPTSGSSFGAPNENSVYMPK